MLAARPRANAPPLFGGKNIAELRRHLQGCKAYFNAIGEHGDEQRVATAASYLRDDALSQWDRTPESERPVTWSTYENVLRDMISDPANRAGIALLAIKRAEQEQGQTVRALATVLDEYWEDVPEDMATEPIQAWALLNALQSDLRVAVLREERTITTRNQVIAAAQRQEILGVGPQRPQNRAPEAASRGLAPHTNRVEGKSLDSNAQSEKRDCFRCGERGHLVKHCPKKT